MNERREGGWWRCGWWRYPGGPIRVLLAFTAAGLVVIPLLLVLIARLPVPPPPLNGDDPLIVLLPLALLRPPPPPLNGDDPLKDMAKALQGIEESLSGARDLSITVKLDEGQWKEIKTELQEAAGPRGCGDGLTCKVGRIAGGVEKIADDTDRIATCVEHVSGEANAIASSVKDIAVGVGKIAGNTGQIATEVEKISNETGAIADGMKHMTRPWACESPDCLGAVHFPHDWPEEESIGADGECEKREEWGNEGLIPEPIRKELDEIVSKLPSPPPSKVWVVGHASTLGYESHNEDLSMRRAEFVRCRLEKKLGNQVRFKMCSTGERGSADSLCHPDAWYRVVQVFTEEPQVPIKNQMQCE